jgi:hypothetical protein
MKMPGFKAEAALYQRNKMLEVIGVRVGLLPGADRIEVQPQGFFEQFQCSVSGGEIGSVVGRCTGMGGPQSVEVLGTTQECRGWFQYPWVEFCDHPWGSYVTGKGCGFCFR